VSIFEHFRRGLGESTRHNSLAYGYSLALTGAFGMLTVVAGKPNVGDIFAFGIGAALTFSIANTAATEGFTKKIEDEPPIVLALGTSFGFVSVSAALGSAALFAWLLPDWLGWGVGAFAASLVYLVITAFEFVLARGVRSLTGRERLEER
jgi:MFS family permease